MVFIHSCRSRSRAAYSTVRSVSRATTNVSWSQPLDANRPLTLPCGHVYCLDCVDKMTKYGTPTESDDAVLIAETSGAYIECPQDKKIHHGDARTLACCFAILANLPNGQSKGYSSFKNTGVAGGASNRSKDMQKPRYVMCSRHPNKKVRYFCESCTAFPCSDCVTEHSGSAHHFSSFMMTSDKKRKDFDEVYRQFKSRLDDSKAEQTALDSARARLSLDHEQEAKKLDAAYERAIQTLK